MPVDLPASPSASPFKTSVPLVHRLAVAGALLLALGASWAWLLYQDWSMRHMDLVAMAMPSSGPWSTSDLTLIFTMWAIMMVAMMLPSVLPMLYTYRAVAEHRRNQRAGLSTAAFALAYLLVWTLFSLAATLAQWWLHEQEWISGAMVVTIPWLAGAVLVAAGAYQWTPLKDACLTQCRAPLSFLADHWRGGVTGAFALGLLHGVYCAGCCVLLMLTLFVFGVMNMLWIVALTLYVLVEKLLLPNRWFARLSGTMLIGWGLGIAFSLI